MEATIFYANVHKSKIKLVSIATKCSYVAVYD